PTLTMPPLAGSPAIDAGSDSATNSFTTDQRGLGFPRLMNVHVDIGAFESQPSRPIITCPVDCPKDLVLATPPGSNAALATFTAKAVDNCGANGLIVTCVPPSGSYFAVGTNTVTCVAT